ALIAVVVPREATRPFVLLGDDERTVLPQILARREAAKPAPHLFGATLQDATNHHARPRCDCRTAVRHLAGVGGVDLDVVVRQAERVGDNLRVHRPSALTDLRAADENPDA